MTPPDALRIAAGLTEDVVEMLMRFDDFAWSTGVTAADMPALYPLAKQSLVQSSHNVWMWRLTPLGRAVRAAIAENGASHGGSGS